MPKSTTKLNPFPGLRPFEPDEDYLFFGRESQSDELLERLHKSRFLATVGGSGSGKSSLVRAGLLPALYGGFMVGVGSSWRVALFRPGSNPIRNMAEALNKHVFGTEKERSELQLSIAETALRRSALGLVEVTRQARLPARENLLVVVDQFEEIFRFKQEAKEKNQDDAAAFVKLLLEATKQTKLPIYVILTMRSDFIGDCSQFRDLPEAINDSQFLVPRLTRDQCREAITGPIKVGGGEITPRLVQRLLNDLGDDPNDLGDNPDQLPILQHALMRTWERWTSVEKNGSAIDLKHYEYEEIGGMANALSKHADEAYDELPDERSKETAKRLFQAITEKRPDNREIRRPTIIRDICKIIDGRQKEVTAIIDKFRQRGRSFLMPPHDVKLHADSLIDISHESLIRNWDLLKEWVDDEADSARTYRRLAETAILYPKKAALYRDADLQTALKWQRQNQPNKSWAQRYHPKFYLALKFLEESTSLRDAKEAEKEADRKRELQQAQALAEEQKRRAEEQARSAKRFRRLTLSLMLVIVIAFLILSYAFWQGKANLSLVSKIETLSAKTDILLTVADSAQAEIDRADAKVKLANIKLAKADSQLIVAGNQIRINKHQADSLANAAGELRDSVSVQRIALKLDREEDALRRKISIADYLTTLAQDSKTIKDSTLSTLLALTAYDFNREVQEELQKEKFKSLRNDLREQPIDFNKEYHALRKTLNRVEPGLGGPKTFKHSDWVRTVTSSPNGELLASGDEIGNLQIINLKTIEPFNLEGHTASVRSLVFSPDGSTLASGSDDRTIRLWNVKNSRSEPTVLDKHQDRIWALAMSPNGRLLASGGADSTVFLWELSKLKEGPAHRLEHTSRIRSITIGSNSRWLAVAGDDGTIRFWDLSGSSPTIVDELMHESGVSSLALSPGGSILAAGGSEGKVLTWRISQKENRPDTLLSILNHEGPVNSIAFSPDSKLIATASSDKRVKIWATDQESSEPKLIFDHDSWVFSVAFTPDGKHLVSGSADKLVRVWFTQAEMLAEKVCEIVGRDLTRGEWRNFVSSDIPYEPTCRNLTTAKDL